ncbi:MAG: hypothetical protein OER95_04820 [Acidimicrobiia bacterium]|nr:hypothetical protein [Acidimicrobiia bacterium]
MEFLERVVGENGGIGLLGHLEDEGVAPPNRPGRRDDDLAGVDRSVEGLDFLLRDSVGEGGVDDDGHVVSGIVGDEGPNRFIQLVEAGQRTTLGRYVGSIDHDVSILWCHDRPSEPRQGGKADDVKEKRRESFRRRGSTMAIVFGGRLRCGPSLVATLGSPCGRPTLRILNVDLPISRAGNIIA